MNFLNKLKSCQLICSFIFNKGEFSSSLHLKSREASFSHHQLYKTLQSVQDCGDLSRETTNWWSLKGNWHLKLNSLWHIIGGTSVIMYCLYQIWPTTPRLIHQTQSTEHRRQHTHQPINVPKKDFMGQKWDTIKKDRSINRHSYCTALKSTVWGQPFFPSSSLLFLLFLI